MNNFCSVSIDPSTIAFPPIESSIKSIRKYVLQLLELNKISISSSISLYFSEDLYSALYSLEIFPEISKLTKILSRDGLEDVDAKSVKNIVVNLMRNQKSLEDRFELESFVFKNVKTESEFSKCTFHNALKSEFEQQCVKAAYINSTNLRFPFGHYLMLRKINESRIKVLSQIHRNSSISDLNEGNSKKSTFEFTGIANVFDTYNCLMQTICGDEYDYMAQNFNSCDIENLMKNDNVLEFIIETAINSYDSQRGIDTSQNVPIVGLSFNERCKTFIKEQGDSFPRSLIKAIVELSRDTKKRKLHALRTGEGGNNPQQKCNGWKAYRYDVDLDAHIHFWKNSRKEHIILSWLGHHGDFYIPTDPTNRKFSKI